MRRFATIAFAALALAACSQDGPVATGRQAGNTPRLSVADGRWTIFTSQQPNETLDAAPGWEVSTRFRSSKSGKVVGFRFWRAAGESGTNTAKLWTDGGSRMASRDFGGGGPGWVETYLTTPVSIAANTDYRVSVNTNVKQVKCGGCFALQGAATNGPLFASGGHYGQPIGQMPTSGSASMFFVDVIFQEDPPPVPNLFPQVVAFGGTDINRNELVNFSVCNNGTAATPATKARGKHWWSPLTGGAWQPRWNVQYNIPPLGPGGCYPFQAYTRSEIGHNLYEIFSDDTNLVVESNEGDNYRYTIFTKQW